MYDVKVPLDELLKEIVTMKEVKTQCEHCREWKILELGKHLRRKYCSDRCRQDAYRKRRKMSDKSCAMCGEFIPEQNMKFCDAACKRTWDQQFRVPYQPSLKAIMRARAFGDMSIISELERVLSKYIRDD